MIAHPSTLNIHRVVLGPDEAVLQLFQLLSFCNYQCVFEPKYFITNVFFFNPIPSPLALHVKIFTQRTSTGRSLPDGSVCKISEREISLWWKLANIQMKMWNRLCGDVLILSRASTGCTETMAGLQMGFEQESPWLFLSPEIQKITFFGQPEKEDHLHHDLPGQYCVWQSLRWWSPLSSSLLLP